ncbi:hypothetical protein J2X01_004241, partial [Arthrobacter ginsengisoli]|nr:hypothetical protein [Arthrobacter ginsengisoli]
ERLATARQYADQGYGATGKSLRVLTAEADGGPS